MKGGALLQGGRGGREWGMRGAYSCGGVGREGGGKVLKYEGRGTSRQDISCITQLGFRS